MVPKSASVLDGGWGKWSKVPTALLVVSLISGIEVGTSYSQFAGAGTHFGAVLEMLAVVSSAISLTWLGFVGINLLGDGCAARRV